MAVELAQTSVNGSSSLADKETLYMLGGISLVVFGTGLILSNPMVRRYMGQLGLGNLAKGVLPDIDRYLKLRGM